MVAQHYRWDFIGLSTDDKPTPDTSPKVVDGSTFYCSDNSKLYVFYKNNWYERKPLGGGGGSYTAGTGIDISDDTISVDTETIQSKLTAGTNISISEDVISATDTTYSNFTGTDGTAAGVAGLVPAPATTDAGKYLKADGTWDSVQGGPTVSQSIGTSQTDVMSQDATTKLVFPSNDRSVVKIGPQTGTMGTNSIGIGTDGEVGNYGVVIGKSSSASPNSCTVVGSYATISNGTYATAIGASANCAGAYSIAIGNSCKATSRGVSIGHNAGKGSGSDSPASYSICVGEGSLTTSQGEMNIADYSATPHGYNDTNYRLITGVHDGQTVHDAATVAQGNTLATSAPTTATVGVLGQLYTDTTNMHTYQCTAISGNEYTWTQRW